MKKKIDHDTDNYSSFLKGSALWESGQARKAFKLFLKAAMNGDASSQHNVGYMYDVGDGIKKNSVKALYWYKCAWKNDRQSGTCCNIARLYEELCQDRRAIYWWNKAIEFGDGDAALDLAKYLQKRQAKCKTKIIKLLETAIQSKHVTPDCVDEAKALLQSFQGKSGMLPIY